MRGLHAVLFAALVNCLFLSAARAEDYRAFLVNQNNDPVGAVLVTLHPLDDPVPQMTAQADLEIAQRDLRFDPGMLIAPLGSEVAFPNADNTGHHVYSFSPAKIFDLRIIAGGQSESVLFDRAGTVAIGCNIHDNMVGFIHVVDTPWAAISNAAGLVQIPDVPDGRYRLRVWHEALDARNNQNETEITLTPARVVEDIQLDLRRQRHRRGRY